MIQQPAPCGAESIESPSKPASAGAGASFEEILKDFPFLEREDILATLDWAAYQTDRGVLSAS